MNSEPPVFDPNGWRPSIRAGTCKGWETELGAGRDGLLPMPTVCQPKMLPPSVNAQASFFTGAPKEGARPPAAGAACGASGESPTPGGTGDPGSAAVAAVAASCACALPKASSDANASVRRNGET